MPPTEKNYSTLLGHKVKSYKPCYEKAVALFYRNMHAVHDKIDFLFAVHDGDKIKNIPIYHLNQSFTSLPFYNNADLNYILKNNWHNQYNRRCLLSESIDSFW